MSFQSLRTHVRASLIGLSFAAGVLLVPAGGLAATADDVIAVHVDQAKLVRFPDLIATVVIGNPLIADVSMQPGGIVIVTGRGYGATNVIGLNRRGEVLMDRTIQVAGPTDKVVTIYRGINRESYSCTPNCERRITLGDSEAYFKSTLDQAGALSNSAFGAAAKGN